MTEKKRVDLTPKSSLSNFPSGGSIGDFMAEVQNWLRDFEASQRKELINLRHNDKRDIAIRRALIFYIEKKVLGIKRDTLGKEFWVN
jgi:hypothetical protein